MCWGENNDNLRDAPRLSADNVQLVALLTTLVQSTYRPVDLEAYQAQRDLRIEMMLTNLVRTRSQKQMTLLMAQMSLLALRAQMSPSVWRMVSIIAPGIFASRDWTVEFSEYAIEFRPKPLAPSLPSVGACMFDNYTRRVLYESQKMSITGGFLLHMTNLCSMHVPALLTPPNFNPESLFRSPFGSSRISMTSFMAKFTLANAEITANKKSRFALFLRKSASGTLFARPAVTPTWVAHITYHEPMWGVLQSFYDDVEAELNVLRNRHLDKNFLFVGGDGLSIIRVNHLICKHPDLYQDSALPFIIPVQGESPHGVYHILHAGWRLYVRFLRICAKELDLAKAIVDDPTVKVFNTALYFLWRVTRAASEYLVHISGTAGGVDIDLPSEFMDASSANTDLQWLSNFLYHYAYLVLDFKQAVRVSGSQHLDILCREFFSLGHTSTANKTHYVPVAIMRIFWSDALDAKLAALYHSMRSIPMSQREGSMMSWDCVVEWLNAAITEGLSHHVSEERIERYIKVYPLLQANFQSLKEHVLKATDAKRIFMKDMDVDVGRLKDLFFNRIGYDWATATRTNLNSTMGLTRGQVSWKEVFDAMTQSGPTTSVPATVARHVRAFTHTFYTFAP